MRRPVDYFSIFPKFDKEQLYSGERGLVYWIVPLNKQNSMKTKTNSDRREFIKKAAVFTGAVCAAGSSVLAMSNRETYTQNSLPKWKGFNLLDFFSPNPDRSGGGTTEEDFKWMSDWGFDFVRIPMAYPSYLDFDRNRDITPKEVYSISEEAVERVDQLVYMAHKYNMHVSLNLHRALGYCINAGFQG